MRKFSGGGFQSDRYLEVHGSSGFRVLSQVRLYLVITLIRYHTHSSSIAIHEHSIRVAPNNRSDLRAYPQEAGVGGFSTVSRSIVEG